MGVSLRFLALCPRVQLQSSVSHPKPPRALAIGRAQDRALQPGLGGEQLRRSPALISTKTRLGPLSLFFTCTGISNHG